MIAAASLIGFVLALVTATWLASALAAGTVLLARRRLASLGPAAERAAAAASLVLGPLAGLAVVAVLAGQSLVVLFGGAADHCPDHGHHLHLCLVHGAAWAHAPWAVAAVFALGALAVAALARAVLARVRAARGLRRLERLARPAGDDLLVAPAHTAFCFVAGLGRPRVFVSSAAWSALEEPERRAVLAHERAHIAHRDLVTRALLGVAALLGAPILAPRVLALWSRATERLRDHDAARVVDPTTVARALVALARLAARPAPVGLSFVASTDLVDRVEALLAGRPNGAAAARRLLRTAAAVLAGVAVAAIAFADPLHHLLETLLGVF